MVGETVRSGSAAAAPWPLEGGALSNRRRCEPAWRAFGVHPRIRAAKDAPLNGGASTPSLWDSVAKRPQYLDFRSTTLTNRCTSGDGLIECANALFLRAATRSSEEHAAALRVFPTIRTVKWVHEDQATDWSLSRLADLGVRRLLSPSTEGDDRLNFAGAGRPPPPRTDSFEYGGLILSFGAFGRQHPLGRGSSFQL